jgi:hypothetical protein
MSKAMTPDEITCNLSALLPEERSRRKQLAAAIRDGATSIEETPEGYALHLPDDPELQHAAFELILLERRCSPFLTLDLDFGHGGDETVMRVGGGPGVKEFLVGTDVLGCASVPEGQCNCT